MLERWVSVKYRYHCDADQRTVLQVEAKRQSFSDALDKTFPNLRAYAGPEGVLIVGGPESCNADQSQEIEAAIQNWFALQ